MMEWTDRHCRYFHRLLTRHTRLYTEMVTTGALLHGDVPRHLDFDAAEHPVALQLGGSEPDDLAACARLARQWGYDEINLNCGCPSPRVQRGAFGACLMAEAELVARCVRAMREAVDLPVTVKHRIGIDRTESYGFVRDFVGTVHAQGGCEVFIVHARNAWLQGLSPKENREVPPLRPALVHQLKRDFPSLTIAINGGICMDAQVHEQLAAVDGVMVGREAYHNPWWLAGWDSAFFGDARVQASAQLGTASPTQPGPTPPAAAHLAAPHALERAAVEEAMVAYMEREASRHGTPWSHIARHMLGLYNGLPGARRWRQTWSDHRLKGLPAREVWRLAHRRPSAEPQPAGSP